MDCKKNKNLLPTASKPLIYLRFLKSYNYTPTITWRQKDVSCEKPDYIGLFCYPNGDFSLYQNADVKSPFSLCGYRNTSNKSPNESASLKYSV